MNNRYLAQLLTPLQSEQCSSLFLRDAQLTPDEMYYALKREQDKHDEVGIPNSRLHQLISSSIETQDYSHSMIITYLNNQKPKFN